MSGTLWRGFVAVPLDEELRGALARAMASWRSDRRADEWRWVEPDALHLTLAFLGAIDPGSVVELASRLAEVSADATPTALATGGLGAFPTARRARVAWYGVADPERRLETLAGSVRAALGATDASPFRPHVTIARARGQRPVDASWLAGLEAPEGRLTVDRIVLYRSHLGGGPARYERLASVPLGAVAHA